LQHLEAFPTERKPEIDRLISEWRSACAIESEARSRFAATEASSAHLGAECDALEREAGSLTPEDRQRLLAALQAPGEAERGGILRVLVSALAGLLLALPRLVIRLAARFRGSRITPAAGAAAYAPITAAAAADLLEKLSRYQEIAPLVRKLKEDEVRAASTARAVVEAEERVRTALSGVVHNVAAPEEAYELFCRNAGLAEEWKLAAGQAQAMENERKAIAGALAAYEADAERAASLGRGLQDELAGLLGRQGALAELVEAFEAACKEREAHDRAKGEKVGMEEKRGLLLRRRSFAELEQMLAIRGREIESILSEAPHLEGARTNEKSQDLRDAMERQKQELQQLEVRMAELKTAIESRLRGLRPRAEVEEEIERQRQDVESLERFGKALGVAIDTVGTAMQEAHRDFAPSVGRLLSEGLERVTDGRYVRAFLDPSSFRVTTEVPETGLLKDVESLSRGTRAAAYLLLRVGLAQHMTSIAEPVPLILDDPLVDLDDVRVEKFLELLADLSREVQILLFTKDESTKAWFEQNLAGQPEHRLTIMPRWQGSPAAAGVERRTSL
jgi:uncharacterized protein YhaN